MSETIETPGAALAVIPAAALPQLMAADTDGILASLAAKVAAFDPDISTSKGREACRSLAYEIARAKTKLDTIGKGLTEDQQKMINAVNAERRLLRERLEELQERVRAPLTAYENAEKARVEAHEAAIRTIEGWADVPAEWTSTQISERIAELAADPLLSRDWQEFAARAQKARGGAHNALVFAHVAAQAREAAAAAAALEAQRQREAEAQARKEREAEIARRAAEQAREIAERKAAEAAQAERERVEAERSAAEEAAARREQQARDAATAAERARQEAEARAKRQAEQAEAARIQRHREQIEAIETADRFTHDYPSAAAIQGRIDGLSGGFQGDKFAEFAEEARQTYETTMIRLRAMLAEAEGREQRRVELLAERQRSAAEEAARGRLDAERAAERAEAERRAANVAHRRSVNNKARDAVFGVLKAEWSDPDSAPDLVRLAQRVVEAIARGDVPSVTISY